MRLRFRTFELDSVRRELTEADRQVDIAPRAFDVLCYLAANRARVVDKAELMDRFWSDRATEAALLKAVSQVRKALREPELVRTVYGKGFRFTAEAEDLSGRAPALREKRWVAVLSVAGAEAQAEAAGTLEGRDLGEGLLGFGIDRAVEDTARRAIDHAQQVLATEPQAAFGLAAALLEVAEEAPTQELAEEAARLAEGAPPGTLHMDPIARDLLGAVAGMEATTYGALLRAAGELPAGVPGPRDGKRARFLGRESEMAFLRARADLLGSVGQGILLTGPPGIGKSRLLREFLTEAADLNLQTLRLNCLPALRNTAFAPLRALIEKLPPLPLEGRDGVDTALLAQLAGQEADDAPLAQLSAHQRMRRTHDLIEALLRGAAPLVLAVEDVHWVDASTQSVLAHLARQAEGMRLLLVMTARRDEAPDLTENVLPLGPLGPGDSMTLLRARLEEINVPQDIGEALVRRAGGNPFFIEELAFLARDGRDPLSEVPQSVQAVLAQRIGGLAEHPRRIAQIAAVIGPPVRAAMVAACAGLPEDGVEDTMQGLMQHGFLTRDLEEFSFRHMLTQDAAYAMIAAADRARLHARIALLLEAEADTPPERLAWHVQEAGETARAVDLWLTASRAALHRSALSESVTFARNGLALVTEGDAARELTLQLSLGTALTAHRGFGFDDVGTAFRRAQSLCDAKTPVRLRIRVLVGLWIHEWVKGRLTQSLAHANEIETIADKLGDPSLLLQAGAGVGQVLFHRGDMATARDHLAAGLGAIADASPETAPAQNAAVSCAAYLGWAEALMGRDAAARQALEYSRDLAMATENPYADAIHHALSVETHYFLGDDEGCLAYANRAISVSREHDFAFWLGTGLVMRGAILGHMGQFDAAEEAMAEGITVFEATGAGVQLANWHGLRADLMRRMGRMEEGRAAARHALACAAAAEDDWFAPRIHAVAAVLATTPEEAAAHADTAKTLARGFGYHPRMIELA